MKAATKPFCTKLNLQNDVALFFYSSHVTPLHRHNALQLIFDLKNEFLFRTNNTSWSKHKCLIIKEETPHQISTNNSLQLILYLDKANPVAKSISEKYLINNCSYEPNVNLSLMEEIYFKEIY